MEVCEENILIQYINLPSPSIHHHRLQWTIIIFGATSLLRVLAIISRNLQCGEHTTVLSCGLTVTVFTLATSVYHFMCACDAPTGLTFNKCMLCPHCIYVFCTYLRTNSDFCPIQHKLIGFYNRDEKCLLCGKDWVFNIKQPALHLQRVNIIELNNYQT